MAANVFGIPVTEGNRMERARQALNNPNAGGKRAEALAYVRRQKETWGTGVSTLAIFYNATGDSMVFTKEDSSHGHIYDSYPSRVQNGQWGAFLHVKTAGAATGSEGFVVYRTKANDNEFRNQLIAWSTPWNQASYDNQSYGDIFDDQKVDASDEVYRKMAANNKRQNVVIKKGLMTTTKIDEGTSPLYEAEFIHADVAARKTSTEAFFVEDAVEASPSTEPVDVVEASPSTEAASDVVKASPAI